MRLPFLTSMEMISIVGPWVPDLPGCCPTKWQVLSSQAQGTTEVRPEACLGSLKQSGSTRSGCSPSEKGLQGAALPDPEFFRVGRHNYSTCLLEGAKGWQNQKATIFLFLESREGSVFRIRIWIWGGV